MSSDQQKIAQATLLRDGLKAAGKRVRIHPGDDPAVMEYMLVQETMLVRSDDMAAAAVALDHQPHAAGWTSQNGVPLPGVTTVKLPPSISVHEACDAVDAEAGRAGAGMPDHVIHVTPLGCCPATEPVLPQTKTPVPAATPPGPKTGEGVVVVVVDTGRQPETENAHRWLHDIQIEGDTDGGQAQRYRGHGTFVCGVLRAIAPRAEITVSGRFFRQGGIVESELADALRTAITSGAAVISMSAGTTSRDGLPPIALEAACKLLGAGQLLVAAAGNDGSATENFYPAAFAPTMPRVVAAGALNATSSAIADYSNKGPWVSVYARGSDVVNAFPKVPAYEYQEPPMKGQPNMTFGAGLASWSGTSFATPIVSGLIAVEVSKQPGMDPKAAWATVLAGGRGIGGITAVGP